MYKYLASAVIAASLISCAPSTSTNESAQGSDRERSGQH